MTSLKLATEEELVNTFGKPIGTDAQYEYWMSASSFLSYGGVLKVVRTAGSNYNNANAGVGSCFYYRSTSSSTTMMIISTIIRVMQHLHYCC